MVPHTYHSSYVRGLSRRIKVQPAQMKNSRPYLKNNQSKMGWGHGSSGSLPSKHEVLGSNTGSAKNNNKLINFKKLTF
jgi:hypothetical protein